ncbi:DUF4012 domain-containing protein [Nocardioides marinquilinus]|uniref:DUF4012 domain-containing protein n=1 Tax=Nocardioides marinquilinus TaxID=1210400 RepID=A0ABP9PMZ4_9ACTN
MTKGRWVLLVLVVLLAAAAWTAWTAYQTARDLQDAEAAATRLRTAFENGDDAGRDAALADLQEAASSAKDRTDGLWWGAMTKVPGVGDDAAGVEALSASLDLLANDAVGPLVETVDSLDGLVSGGRIDPDRLAALAEPVDGAAAALREAARLVEEQDSSGYVTPLRTRYDEYTSELTQIAGSLDAAEDAVRVLPSMLGADGPRDYLFVFQNNAEVRSTGGLPGSWARVHVEDGVLELREQGNGSAFGDGTEQKAQLTEEELAVYDELPAVYFQDAGFIPDFPRAATLIDEFWAATYPRVGLDGVIALDPVGLSYLLGGTGPVTAGPLTLDPGTVVSELLNATYLTVADPEAQDRRFQAVARAVFATVTGDVTSPLDLVRGVDRAVDEGRLLVASFDPAVQERLAGTAITGALTGDDGATPHVDIGVNDSTGSKMSFYLRWAPEVTATSCADGVQTLEASVTLNQTISPAEAARLPDSITGGGYYGIEPGTQLVTLRVYGPFGGTIDDVRIDGKRLPIEKGLEIDGRPVVSVAPLIDTTDDVVVTWTMRTGAGQTGPGEVGVTPGVEPGDLDTDFASAC